MVGSAVLGLSFSVGKWVMVTTGPGGCTQTNKQTHKQFNFRVLLWAETAAGRPGGRPPVGPPARTHFNVVTVVTSQCQCSFCFGATGPPVRLHQFANKVGSLQVVLGWNRQTSSDYIFVVSRLMKIRLMMTRKRGTGPGGARHKNTQI